MNQLLAQKGYDAMTVDGVAAQVGLTKPSLYKHFESKEALAAAALIRLLDQALAATRAQPTEVPAGERLRAVLRWALTQHLAGAMPLLPSTRSSLREALLKNERYVERLQALSALLLEWIDEAQRDGQIDATLPSEVVLYTLFARSCDPVLDFLRDSGQYDDTRVLDLVLATSFDGLRPRR
ncbi:MAG: helix-turn-helix domain-containing protein [Burkholderiaceae bacterium]|nr:helix-turn-helix domain-containing protein [Burkholderiaceae bacterium]